MEPERRWRTPFWLLLVSIMMCLQEDVKKLERALEEASGDVDVLLTCEWPFDVSAATPPGSAPAEASQPGAPPRCMGEQDTARTAIWSKRTSYRGVLEAQILGGMRHAMSAFGALSSLVWGAFTCCRSCLKLLGVSIVPHGPCVCRLADDCR